MAKIFRTDIQTVRDDNGINQVIWNNNTQDVNIVVSDNQHVRDTINMCQGWNKQFPSDGCGIVKFIQSRINMPALKNNLQQNLQKDGYRLVNPKIGTTFDGQLVIDLSNSVINNY